MAEFQANRARRVRTWLFVAGAAVAMAVFAAELPRHESALAVPQTIYSQNFDSFPDGADNPGGWTDINTIASDAEVVTGAMKLLNTAAIWRVISAAGFKDIRVTFDCSRDSDNDPDDDLAVEYSSDNGASWALGALIETNFASTTCGLYSTSGNSVFLPNTVDLSAIAAIENTAAFALRFRSTGHTANEAVFIDNVVVGGEPVTSTTTVTKTDLEYEATHVDGSYNLGQWFTYRLAFTVSDAATAADQNWNDVLPAGLGYVGLGSSDNPGNKLNCGGNPTTDVVSCFLPAGTPVGTYWENVTVEVESAATCGSATNQVREGAVDGQGTVVATNTVAIAGCGGVVMDKLDLAVLDGGNVVWYIQLNNTSTVPQTAYILDPTATLVSSVECVNPATQSGGIITCVVPPENGSGTTESLVLVRTPYNPTPDEICAGATRTNTAWLVDSPTEDPASADDPVDVATMTFEGTAGANCITLYKSNGIFVDNPDPAPDAIQWNIWFKNIGPATSVTLDDTYGPNGTGTMFTGSTVGPISGCAFTSLFNTVTGCSVALNGSTVNSGNTLVSVFTTVPASQCTDQTVSNTVEAYFSGTVLGATAPYDKVGSYLQPGDPALCTRNLRVVKFTTAATHPGGTFGGGITPGGSTAANQSWSQALAADAGSSAGEVNSVSFDAQTVTETTLAAGWVNAGFYIAPDTGQVCPATLGDYTLTSTVPQGTTSYLVCVRNALVSIEKVSANVNGSSEPYAPGEEFHWDITVTILGGSLKTALQISDSWDDSVVDLVSIEPGPGFSSCSEGPTGTVTCTIPAGTGPGTFNMSLHMVVRAAAGCGTTTNNIAIREGARELDSSSDDVPLDCRRTIQICKLWRLDAPGELADPGAATFGFNVIDAEDPSPGQRVEITGIEEDGGLRCVPVDVRIGNVIINEDIPAGFVLDGWNFFRLPDTSTPYDGTTNSVDFWVTANSCGRGTPPAPLVRESLELVRSIQAVVSPGTGTAYCAVTFINHDTSNRLPTGALRIEKYKDVNGDGDAGDAAIGEGLMSWEVTIVGPDPSAAGVRTLVGGTATFPGLNTGDVYTITEDLPGGYVVTRATVDGAVQPLGVTTSATIPNGGTTVVRFYNQPVETLTVHKVAESVHNGITSAAPDDDDGWIITVSSAACGVLVSKATDANGNAFFDNLPQCTDFVVSENPVNAGSPGFVPVGASSYTGVRPNEQTLTFLNRRTTQDPPCTNCAQPTPTPVTPTATPSATPTRTGTPTIPPATPTSPAATATPTRPSGGVLGDLTPAPAPPNTGDGPSMGDGHGEPLMLLVFALLLVGSGFGVLALTRKRRS